MSTPTTPAKICEICKQDCTSKPRIKDAQGHYFCRECVEKKKASRPGVAPAPAAPKGASPATAIAGDDDRSIMARLVNDSVKTSVDVCPGCRRPLKPQAVICTQCGFNRQTAQVVTTQVLKSQEVKGPKEKGRRRSIEISPWMVGLVLMLVFGGLFAASTTDPMFAAIMVLLLLVTSLVGYILAIVGAFQDGEGGWGIAGLVSLFLGPFFIAFIIYVFFISERGMSKAFFLANIVGWVMWYVAAFQLAQSGDFPGLPPP